MSNFQKVHQFNQTFGITTHNTPQANIFREDPKLVELRMKLIREEVQELEEAVKSHDLTETIDALSDIYANKDNTISNALKSDLINSGSKSNMGASDILEVFSIFAQASTSSLEESRVLISFPIEEISASIARGEIPTAAGSGRSDVKYFIKLFKFL